MKYVSPAEAAEVSRGWFGALDPGLTYPAMAGYYDGELKFASRVPVPGKVKDIADTGARALHVAELCANWWLQKTGGQFPIVLSAEWPFVYPGEMTKDPNDLIALAGIDLGVAAYLGARLKAPMPREWIGQIPKSKTGKAWLSPRGRLIRGRLRDHEIAVVVESHDAVDSVGIGLHALGRLGKLYP